MLQEELKKMNLDNGHEIVVAQIKELFEKYPEQKDEIRVYVESFLFESMKKTDKVIQELAVTVLSGAIFY